MPDTLGAPLPAPLFTKLTIVGLGLIGASLCRAARQQGIAAEVVGADADPAVRARAREIGLADTIADSVEQAVAGADLVILCTPVGAMGAVAAAIAAASGAGRHRLRRRLLQGVRHRGGSPAPAGVRAPRAGPPGRRHGIFRPGRRLRHAVPQPLGDPDAAGGHGGAAVGARCAFWEAVGANVEAMSAAHHDIVLAITSHVPHLIAYNIVRTASDLERVTEAEVMKFSAGGFRDFTRIAASDPTMWRDVFLNNREAVLEVLGRFNEDLSSLQRMVRDGNGEGLFDLFTRTRAIRRGIIAQGQETAAADFGRRVSEQRD